MRETSGTLNFPVSGLEELVLLVKQREHDLSNALKECERLQRERNNAWDELRKAGLRPAWPKG